MSILQKPREDNETSKLEIKKIPVLKQLPEMLEVETELRKVLQRAKGMIHETCTGLLNAGGKRIRPLLTICSSLCFGPVNDTAIQAAVAAELIHMASLVHDDVIDKAELRRGKATANHKYGNGTAVLTGDYIFAEAFRILSTNHMLECMEYLVEAIQAMCDGEVNQAQQLFSTNTSAEDYFGRIAKKTGILLAASCKCGAVSAGAAAAGVDDLGEYGLNLGYAFQIIDDILDFTGSPDKLGKPVGTDIKSGNVTLPVILLMDNPVYGDWIKEVLRTKVISPEGIISIREALVRAGSIEKAYNLAKDCIAKAKAALERIPDSPYRHILFNLTDEVILRQA